MCKITMNDSKSYIEHLNGKSHNSKKGMSMHVEKVSLESVRHKLKELKKKREEE